jgi:hypothetical protein
MHIVPEAGVAVFELRLVKVAIAKALGIGRASVYRALEAG